MEDKRPKLSDPKEFAIVRDMYFEKDVFNKEKIDPIEQLDRMNSRERNLNNNSR